MSERMYRAQILLRPEQHGRLVLISREELKAQFWTADERLRNALAEQGVAWAHWIGAA